MSGAIFPKLKLYVGFGKSTAFHSRNNRQPLLKGVVYLVIKYMNILD
jgi:hypothetical protein